MKLLRSFLFLSLGLLILAPLSAADDDQPKKKRGRAAAQQPERRGSFGDRFGQLVARHRARDQVTLGISAAQVGQHLPVLDRLDASARSQIAAWASEEGLRVTE